MTRRYVTSGRCKFYKALKTEMVANLFLLVPRTPRDMAMGLEVKEIPGAMKDLRTRGVEA
jgi:hypothetical protein